MAPLNFGTFHGQFPKANSLKPSSHQRHQVTHVTSHYRSPRIHTFAQSTLALCLPFNTHADTRTSHLTFHLVFLCSSLETPWVRVSVNNVSCVLCINEWVCACACACAYACESSWECFFLWDIRVCVFFTNILTHPLTTLRPVTMFITLWHVCRASRTCQSRTVQQHWHSSDWPWRWHSESVEFWCHSSQVTSFSRCHVVTF